MSVQGSGKYNAGKKKNTVVSAGLPAGEIKVPKIEESIVLTYDQQFKIVTDQELKSPVSSIIVVAPLVTKITKTGIILPEPMNSSEKMEAFLKWHRVLAVGGNITDIKPGDEVWVNSSKTGAISEMFIDNYPYVKVDYYMVDGIRPYKAENYATKVDDKGKD